MAKTKKVFEFKTIYWISIIIAVCLIILFVRSMISKIVLKYNLFSLSSMGIKSAYYYAQEAMLAILFLSLLMLLVTSISDYQTVNERNKTKVSYRITKWISDTLKISLSIYFGIYWYFKISYFWMKDINIILGIRFIFMIWPALFLMNIFFATMFIINEPWRERLLLKRSILNNHKKSKFMFVLIGLCRIISLIIVFLAFALFASAHYPKNGWAIIGSTCIFSILSLFTWQTKKQN